MLSCSVSGERREQSQCGGAGVNNWQVPLCPASCPPKHFTPDYAHGLPGRFVNIRFVVSGLGCGL